MKSLNRVSPKFTKSKKNHLSTCSPDFLKPNNDGVIPTTRSNVLAIVSTDGKITKTLMDSKASLLSNSDGQFMIPPNESLFPYQQYGSTQNIVELLTGKEKEVTRNENKNYESPLNAKIVKKLNKSRRSVRKFLVNDNPPRPEELLKAKKEIPKATASMNRRIKNAGSQTDEILLCKFCSDTDNDKSESPESTCDSISRYLKPKISNQINYEGLKERKIYVIQNSARQSNESIAIRQREGDGQLASQIHQKLLNKFGTLMKRHVVMETFGTFNRICSILLFCILMSWFLSVLYKMNLPQDIFIIMKNWISSLPLFTTQKRRELTKAEIGLKWLNSVLNLLKRVFYMQLKIDEDL